MKRREGFSIIEAILVMGIFGAIVIVIGLFANDVSELGDFIDRKLQNQQDLQQAFQNIVTEVRSMERSALGSYPIFAASTSSLIFFSDVDRDGMVDRVRYEFVTSTFERGIVAPTGNPAAYVTSTEIATTLMYNVLATSTPVFEYFDETYDGNGMPLSSPITVSDVRVIKIAVYADVDVSRTPQPVFFSRTITVRNLREN